MASPPPTTRNEFINHSVSTFKVFSGGSYLYDEIVREKIAALSYDRCFYPQGFIRQSVAMLADGSRKKRLEKIEMPSIVFQGELDPVVQIEHGLAIFEGVNNANFKLIKDWGHGLDYPDIWPQLAIQLYNWCDTI
jgi:pimeloyl-ACP methyl ester carboxylesterase